MSIFTARKDSPTTSEFVGSREGYVITRERNAYWSRYILWAPDGALLQKNSSYSELVTYRDRLIDKGK